MVNVKIFSAFCVGALSDDVADEVGKTIFEVGKRQVVETYEGLMSPQEFYEQYANLDAGKPILLKGAAKSMPAFKMWSDAAFLVEKFGQQLVGVEELASPAAGKK